MAEASFRFTGYEVIASKEEGHWYEIAGSGHPHNRISIP